MKNKLSLFKRFIKFCESKPKEREYKPYDSLNCPLAQFGKHLYHKKMVAGGNWFMEKRLEEDLFDERLSNRKVVCPVKQQEDAIYVYPHTFGALTERLKLYYKDMRIKKTIRVTAEDIKAANKWRKRGGWQGWSSSCPLSRSLKRSLRKTVFVNRLTFECNGVDYFLPGEATHFIASWDAKEKVKPFKFEIFIDKKEKVNKI